ncbi:Formylglycine-generating enzyme, required for sulfatase activity, contains SUMF1/FGE domain [Parapedobacter composti]|uniref:Formylglycine-generating enzyme, required for sulfatase activity, contains SUMF1/FGE domain n=1 Tax=Parapedobacter composti TaxID=623281 RepID=A0A1I1M5P5_9SPHI|nr:SUMF1/EgtB/PvdO family nonheme iron enzyme [Parapedobacter composti]SFC80817.1 Formylglycine-generating enzyme, required for sulfatase activity, contains SUMF1/FGE domain [Parapedobacter composti]
MKKYLILILICLAYGYAQAQNTVAKLKYEDAEKAFYDGNYQNCISLLDETEKLLGQTAPNILYLRIMAEGKIWEASPYESYEQVNKLQQLCKQYMQNYDIAGLENKYRDVYELSSGLPNVGSQGELVQLGSKIAKNEEETRQKWLDEVSSENKLIFVEGGTFFMGHTQFWEKRSVTLDDFYIGKYEVTVGDYNRYLAAIGAKTLSGSTNKPVTNVSWEDAMKYCLWLREQYGGIWRLPTEAEWEYAARGGKQSRAYKYSGGDKLKDIAFVGDFWKSPKGPTSVGSKLSNELGIYDMSGNVSEWCYDWYSFHYHEERPQNNPMGPEKGEERVRRGGNFETHGSMAFHCEVGYRSKKEPTFKNESTGFRVVLTVSQ